MEKYFPGLGRISKISTISRGGEIVTMVEVSEVTGRRQPRIPEFHTPDEVNEVIGCGPTVGP